MPRHELRDRGPARAVPEHLANPLVLGAQAPDGGAAARRRCWSLAGGDEWLTCASAPSSRCPARRQPSCSPSPWISCWIDLEHGALGALDAQEMAIGAQAAGSFALVRLPAGAHRS